VQCTASTSSYKYTIGSSFVKGIANLSTCHCALPICVKLTELIRGSLFVCLIDHPFRLLRWPPHHAAAFHVLAVTIAKDLEVTFWNKA
jgi:hypothetical protein